jgi:tyrosine-protein kinase Etk/Wzc
MGDPPRKIDDLFNKEKTHLIEYLVVLAKHSRLIVFGGAAVFILVFLFLLILPNTYTSTARLLPPKLNMTLSAQLLDSLDNVNNPGSSGSLGGMSGLGGMAAGLLGLKSPGDLYVGIMRGNTISDRIIDKFNLRRVYKDNYIEDVRKTLSRKVKISVGNKDSIISIEANDRDPVRSANIANAFIEELNNLLQTLAVQEAKARLTFLEKEQALADNNLVNAENALRDFSEKNSVIQIDTQTKDMLLYIARLRAQIDANEVKIQVMRQHATSNNYDLIRLQTEVNGLKNKLHEAEKQYDQVCIGDACLPTSKVPTLGLTYLRLYREVKFQNALNQFYKKMVELARLDLLKNFTVAQVVDKALPPEKRSNKRLIPALVSGIATMFVLILFSFGKELWQTSTISEEDNQHLIILKSYLQSFIKPLSGR